MIKINIKGKRINSLEIDIIYEIFEDDSLLGDCSSDQPWRIMNFIYDIFSKNSNISLPEEYTKSTNKTYFMYVDIKEKCFLGLKERSTRELRKFNYKSSILVVDSSWDLGKSNELYNIVKDSSKIILILKDEYLLRDDTKFSIPKLISKYLWIKNNLGEETFPHLDVFMDKCLDEIKKWYRTIC